MKNIYKISAVLFVSLSIIVSSCKKEDEVVTPTVIVINGCTDNTMFNYDPTANTDDGTCISFIYGCIDLAAINYLSNANFDDGSCIFAYDIALGIWNISSECEALTISIPGLVDFDVPLADIFPETIEITGGGNGVVSMDISGENVLADVSYDGTVTIQDGQKISFDTSIFDPTGLIGEVDVDITGSGTIFSDSNGNLSLTLSFEILGTPQSSTCEITFQR